MLTLRFVELLIMGNINTYWIKKIEAGRRNKKVAE